jgi:hypothetical protein
MAPDRYEEAEEIVEEHVRYLRTFLTRREASLAIGKHSDSWDDIKLILISMWIDMKSKQELSGSAPHPHVPQAVSHSVQTIRRAA